MCSSHTTLNQHVTLTREQLAEFRTHICEQHKNGNCVHPDRCPDSHCQTWQRRNPYRFVYASVMCPNIEFVRKGNKMSLIGRCTRGRVCNYAHSKEEELYHPTMYKTKLCKAYPRCSRYFCPFAHAAEEITDNTHKVSSFSKSFEHSSPHSQQSKFLTNQSFSQNEKFMDYNIQTGIMLAEQKKLLPLVLRESPTSSSTAASSSATPNFILFTSPKTEKDRLSHDTLDENKKNSLFLYSQSVVEEFEKKKKYTNQLDHLDSFNDVDVASLTNQSNTTSPSSHTKNTDIGFITEKVKEGKFYHKNTIPSKKNNNLTEECDTEQKRDKHMHPTTYYSNLENKGKSHVACSETNISKKSFDIDIVQSVGKNGFPLYSLKKDTDTIRNNDLNKYCKTSNFNHFCTELYNQSCEEDNEFSNLRINIEKLDSNLTKYTNNAIFDTSVNEMKLSNFEHIWEKSIYTENLTKNRECNFFSENVDYFCQQQKFSNSNFVSDNKEPVKNNVESEDIKNFPNGVAASYVVATNELNDATSWTGTMHLEKLPKILTFERIGDEKQADNSLKNGITSSHSFLNAISLKLKEANSANLEEKNASKNNTFSYINALANLLVESLTEFTYSVTPPAPPESLQTFPIVGSIPFPLRGSLDTTAFLNLSTNCTETESIFFPDDTEYYNSTDGLFQRQQYKCVVPDTFSFLSV